MADVQDDIGTEKVRLATLADVRDQMEIDRLGLIRKKNEFKTDKFCLIVANLQRCREEREKIIREEALANPSLAKTPVPRKINFICQSIFQLFLFVKNHRMFTTLLCLDRKYLKIRVVIIYPESWIPELIPELHPDFGILQ